MGKDLCSVHTGIYSLRCLGAAEGTQADLMGCIM